MKYGKCKDCIWWANYEQKDNTLNRLPCLAMHGATDGMPLGSGQLAMAYLDYEAESDDDIILLMKHYNAGFSVYTSRFFGCAMFQQKEQGNSNERISD